MHLEVKESFSSTKHTKPIKCPYFFICDKIANGDYKVIYCPSEIMWVDVRTKPKQGGPFCLDRSHCMNVPINYDDNAEHLKIHPLLLPSDERPINPKQTKDQLQKTQIIHSRSVLGIKNPSLITPISGTPPLPITWKLTSVRSSPSWEDPVRIPVAIK